MIGGYDGVLLRGTRRPAIFAVAKNSQGVMPFPQLMAFRGVLSQESDQ